MCPIDKDALEKLGTLFMDAEDGVLMLNRRVH